MSRRSCPIGAIFLALGCSSGTQPAPQVHQFVVRYQSGSPKFAQFAIGTHARVIGEAFDDAGRLLQIPSIDFVSRGPAVMVVDTQGIVTATGVGETQIVASIQTATGVQRDSVTAAVVAAVGVRQP